jgi:hypothetical protein
VTPEVNGVEAAAPAVAVSANWTVSI